MDEAEIIENFVLDTERPADEVPNTPFHALDAFESLSPGSILTPCFEISGSPANYSVLREHRTSSFSRTVHHSSGYISEIRASTHEIESLSVLVEKIHVPASSGDQENEHFKHQTISSQNPDDAESSRGRRSASEHHTDSVHRSELSEGYSSSSDTLDTSFDVTCTSKYLPKTDAALRHVATSVPLDNVPVGPQEEKVGTPTDDETDYTSMESWRNQTRQFFILSDSGKPIYSRHGEEDKLVTLCGVMQALVSVIVDAEGDNLWSMNALGTTVSFLVRTPLLLVTVAKTGESDRQLLTYLNYAYDFILSVLTLSQLSKIFTRYKNFDLRRMLSGTEKILDHLLDWVDEDIGFLLGSVRCLPLPSHLRESINSNLTHSCHKIPGLVFAIVIAKRQLISITRLKKYVLHPSDIRLLINLIDASDSFKAAESWIPICLPKFDASGFLHAYISYLHDSPVCLVYLGVDPNLFHALSKTAATFSAKMESSGDLDAVLHAMKTTSYYSASQSGVAELRHFIYKSTLAAQLTSPFVTQPYIDMEQRQKLRNHYRYLHRRMHCPTRAAKIIVVTSNTEMLLGWVTSNFELYAVLEPSITKHHAVIAIEKLIKWIKKEENHLFILNSPVFS